MFLRRLATAFKSQDWVIVITELAMVFAGVLIALQFDNWNTTNRNQRALDEMLERVVAELDLNDDIIATLSEQIEGGSDARAAAFQALDECDGSETARVNMNSTLNDLARDYSPSLSSISLEQLNRRDAFLDLLSLDIRTALGVYSNHLQEEQNQLRFNAGLRWDQHVMTNPLVTIDLNVEEGAHSLAIPQDMTLICDDPAFRRQFFITVAFVESTRLRLQRFKEYMDAFRLALEAEISDR